MKRLTATALSVLMVTCVGQATAELKKQREWPSSIPAPSPELKKQYEYDPEAGGASDKLVSTTDVLTQGPKTLRDQRIEYRKGVPVSGNGGWFKMVMVYHGYAAMYTTPELSVVSVKFSSTGPWPAKSFKVFTESRTPGGDPSKVAFSCTEKTAFSADDVFKGLPGKIYVHDCKFFYAADHSPELSPEGEPYVSYYSDYLGMPVFAKQKPLTLPGGELVTTYGFTFLDKTGIQKTITFTDSYIRTKLD